MSPIPYFNIARRSIPIPNAKPFKVFESYFTKSYTAGSTIPAPNNSIHPEPLHFEQPMPVPPQKTHDASNSTEGSVNGKKLGRKRVFTFGPKNSRTKYSI